MKFAVCSWWFWLAMLVVSVLPQRAWATHIVGGEMSYRCLGNDQYEISLTIYRDCFFGNPNAYFDDPASIGIFDSNNNLLQDVRVQLMGDDTLAPVLTNECLVIPPDVCVHTTTYRTTVNLPPRPGGYQLAYQRCCRNQTIANIIDPLATGATYGVRITERALRECNSSAEFLEWPPLYICANEPIRFDQSAIDRDGDSIVYRLCAPWQGADQNIPRPQPPNAPPYDEVVWRSPYGLTNMLNGLPGGEPLQIDARTGLLTGTPNTVGQFVVGICAEEYRDGELISTLRRDFQYNVGICGQVNAAFLAPEVQCGDLEVNFSNRSQQAASYLWYFDFGRNPNAFSTAENPSFTYPDTGRYTVALIAAPGSACADTFLQEIRLQSRTLFPAFTLDTLSCGDSLVVRLEDQSTAVNAEITAWQWSLNGEVFSRDPQAEINLGSSGSYRIGLQLSADNGCVRDSLTVPLPLQPFTVTLDRDRLTICTGDTVELYPSADPNLLYEWRPLRLFSDPEQPNPRVSPTVNTRYLVTITNPQTSCQVDREVGILVNAPPSVELIDTVITCADIVELSAESPTATAFQWSVFPDFTTVFAQEARVEVSPLQATTFYLEAVDDEGCRRVDSVWVNSLAVNLEVPSDQLLCLGDTLEENLVRLDPFDTLLVDWQPTAFLIGNPSPTTASWVFPEAGSYSLSFLAENQYNCQSVGEWQVTVIDTVQQLADYRYTQCSGREVVFSSSSPHAAILEWDFGDPNDPEATGRGPATRHTYQEAGDYLVQIRFGDGLACADTLLLPVRVEEEGPPAPEIIWDYTVCTDTLGILLRAESGATDISAYQWYLSDSLLTRSPEVELGLPASGSYSFSLVTLAANGCRDTITEIISPRFIDLDLGDTLTVCPGQPTPLYPGADTSFVYQWAPPEGLDEATLPNPIVTTNTSRRYTVTISDPRSVCRREAAVWVAVAPPISYELSGPVASCATAVNLRVDTDPDNRVRWYADSTLDTLVAMTPEWVAPVLGPTTYYLTLTDELGCQVLDSLQVNGQGISLGVEVPELLCRGDSIRLVALTESTSPIVSYAWSPAASIIEGADTATPLVAPLSDMSYELQLSNGAGCVLDTTVLVRVSATAPQVLLLPAIDTILPGENIQLSATFDPDWSYTWSPVDGLDASNVFDPVASPAQTTRYWLTVTDRNGCTTTVSSLIVVLNSPCIDPYIFVPSAFSPNGDQLNDELRVEGNVIDEFYLVIYNRWGEEVFRSQDQRQGWDGTYKGRALPADVYAYYLEVRCWDGALFQDKGNITLVR